MEQARYALKSYEFRRERETQWRELERLVEAVEAKGAASLGSDELYRLPSLYRAALSSLSVARAISLDKNVIAYLDALCARAYLAVYARKRRLFAALLAFFSQTFPRLVRNVRWALLLSVGLLALGTVTGYVLTASDSDRYFTFVGEEMAGGRTPASTREDLAEALTDDGGGTVAALTQFAAFLFTHNAKIGLMCFALGLLAGVPVMLLLFINGLSLGAMWALYAGHGLGFEFLSWVMPHGVTELLAVAVCGAAGLAVGYGLVFPGRYRRLDNLALRGRQAAAIAIGAVAMFFVAALIEGFFRQLVSGTDVRVVVVIATSLLWFVYFGFVGRSPEERGDRQEPRPIAASVRARGAAEPGSAP
ncbi:MAG: hypothetical protein CSA66_03930 [Proteobacteria bacterium]|nr:MAG: hypothetical protein CSA66_03930 [Pseudomonadota bacterium]